MARVLVIDDDEEIRTLVRAMLTGVGHEVEDAIDGEEGLRIFEERSTDLVITDINMPGMDGHDVIKAFRGLNAGVPIVAMSGGGAVSGDDLLINAAALGAVEVIMKPFEFGQLVGSVDRALSR